MPELPEGVAVASTVPLTTAPNVGELIEMVDAALELVPVPAKVTVWGLPVAVSVMLTVALSNTADEGWNVTLITQLDPAAKLDPQVFV
jgi:hypothetical protein